MTNWKLNYLSRRAPLLGVIKLSLQIDAIPAVAEKHGVQPRKKLRVTGFCNRICRLQTKRTTAQMTCSFLSLSCDVLTHVSMATKRLSAIRNSSRQFFRMHLTPHGALSWQTGIYSSGKASTSWCDKLQATWPKLCQSCHVDHSSFSCTAVESSPPGTLTKCLIIYAVVRRRWMWRKTDVLISGFILPMKLQALLKELLSAWYITLKPFASHLLKCHSLLPYLRV